MKRFIIRGMTTQDVAIGDYCAITKCPVALAIKRRFPNKSVNVGTHSCYIDGVEYKLSKKGIDFIMENIYAAQRGMERPEPVTIVLTRKGVSSYVTPESRSN